MKLDKKQVPQLAVLGVLVLACVGYVSFTVFKPPAIELTPPSPKQSAKSRLSGSATVAISARAIPATAAFPDLGAPIPRRDPFTVQVLVDSDTPTPDKQTNPKAAPEAQKAARLASSKVPPLIPAIGSFTSNLLVLPSNANQDPDFVLTGVICGLQNVAIIRVGDSERHVVKQGQFIDGRYRVLAVTPNGAVLACGNRRIHLRLGGVPNAS
jgi:hypothetical protein